jgi:hypothetical protein
MLNHAIDDGVIDRNPALGLTRQLKLVASPGEPASLSTPARRSRAGEEQPGHLGNRLTVLESIGEHAQRQRFDPRHRLVACLGVDHNAGEARHLGDPATILLAFQLYRESLVGPGASMPPEGALANTKRSCDPTPNSR